MSANLTLSAPNVGVVGAGAVGQAVATALVVAGFCKQLIIASRTLEQATSLAADLDDMRVASEVAASGVLSPAGSAAHRGTYRSARRSPS